MAKIIALANQKGGVGKTTTAINLSEALVQKGKRVLLVDIDPQANSTSGVGVSLAKDAPSIYEVLSGTVPAERAILKAAAGIDVLPTRIDLAAAEVELVSEEGREQRLKRCLQHVRDNYDFILIDCQPSLGLLTVNALTAADSVLIPLQCEYYAMEGLGQLLKTIRRIRENLNPSLGLEGILLTMYDARNNLSDEVKEQVEANFQKEAFKTVIPRNVRLSEAPSYGTPINMYDKSSVGAAKYNELADELLARNGL
ncbi:AAA family ATPase [Deferribacterales bacterium RsTz2092]|nr:sporulation initiation inhibitor Soj [Deferribacterales bacterium]